MGAIHVCFAVRDRDGNYSKLAGAAIASLLRKTKARVTVHLFHDDTIAGKQLGRFQQLVHVYGQDICCYQIHAEEEFGQLRYMPVMEIFSLGTMFRLKIPELLPESVDKVLYLDADTLTNLDVQELWDIPFDGALVIGKQDKMHPYFKTYRLFAEGHLRFQGYVNAGVLLLDLAGIRKEHQLQKDAMDFFKAFPDTGFPDMDALNYILRGRTKTVDEKYNLFTFDHRGKQEPLRPAIYHFAGDHVRAAARESFEQLFFDVLEQTPWKNEMPRSLRSSIQHLEDRCQWFQHLVFQMAGKRLVFWGVKTKLRDQLMNRMSPDVHYAHFIDNNPELQGTSVNGLPVYAPDVLEKYGKGNVFVIVLALRRYDEIRAELERRGMIEGEDFICAKDLHLEDEWVQ